MKDKFVQAHMKVAKIYADLSYAKRKKVGAVIVRDDRILSIGYNGTPAGWDNRCEDSVLWYKEKQLLRSRQMHDWVSTATIDRAIL